MQALRLFRGPALEFTAPAPWLDGHRARWQQVFRELAGSTLARMRALDDDRAAELLCVRAAAILPEDEELNNNIIDFMMARDRQPELVRYLSHLSRNSRWMFSF